MQKIKKSPKNLSSYKNKKIILSDNLLNDNHY